MIAFLQRIGEWVGVQDKKRAVVALGVSLLTAWYYLFCVGTLSVPVFTTTEPTKYYSAFRFD